MLRNCADLIEYLMGTGTRTLFCDDLFTQGGTGGPAVRESDILEPSEAFRKPLDCFSHSTNTGTLIENPGAGAAGDHGMHGSPWIGNGAALLRALRNG